MRTLLTGILLQMIGFAAGGQAPVELIGRDLSRTTVWLTKVEGDRLSWVDADGSEGGATTPDILGLIATNPDAGSGVNPGSNPGAGGGNGAGLGTLDEVLSFQPAMLRLVDGRKLTGAPSGRIESATDEEGPLRWQHPVLGAVEVPLEQIDRLVLQRTSLGPSRRAVLPPADTDDLVLLRNGDRLRGFVVGIGRELAIETEAGVSRVPFEAIDQVALANPRERWAGPMVWLRDGSVLGVTSVSFDGDTMTLNWQTDVDTEAEPDEPERSVAVPHELVRAVVFDSRRVVPLVDLLPAAEVERVSRVGASRAVGGPADDPPLGAEPLSLSGRDELQLALPVGAESLSLRAALPLRARAWGRGTLVVRLDGMVRARLPVSASEPVADAVVQISGASELSLGLEPGEFGEVHAEVSVMRAIIAIDAEP
ncbi:MAG: hypothetical protein AAFR96_02025 [Planctomycetota bacterium]